MQLGEIAKTLHTPCGKCGAHPEIEMHKASPAGGSLRYRQENTKVTIRLSCDCWSVAHKYSGCDPQRNSREFNKLVDRYLNDMAQGKQNEANDE